MKTRFFTNGFETSKANYIKALAMAIEAHNNGASFEQDQMIIDGERHIFINNVPQLF